MAFAGVAEDALRASDDTGAQRYLEHALADIEACLATLTLLAERPAGGERYPALQPALVFDRARLGAQLRIVTGQYEEAIELAESGADELETMLNNLGYGEEQCADDAGLRYLRGMSVQLRREYGITHTLSEQLAEAVEHEDFETAAQLRDELQRRQKDGRRTPGVPEA